MRPSSLGGGRTLRRTLSVCLSVCLSVRLSGCILSVRLSVRPSRYISLPSVTSRHLANYNDTHVLFGMHRGPHIVRPSRPHKLVFIILFLFVFIFIFVINFFLTFIEFFCVPCFTYVL